MCYVCSECVNDSVLAEVVCENLCHNACTFCGKTSSRKIASDVGAIVEVIQNAVKRDFNPEFQEEAPWDQEEQCFWGITELTAHDVLVELDFCPDSEELFEYVCGELEDEYVKRDALPGTLSERQIASWGRFCEVVKHQRRFTFWNDPTDTLDYAVVPQHMVSHVCEQFREANLFRTLAEKTRFWRVRVPKPGQKLGIPHDYCSVPIDRSQNANRMSPPGVSMFYGADTFETACVETVNPNDEELSKKCVCGVCFESLRPLRVFDLTELERPRSQFEQWEWRRWELFRFLNDFVADLSKPVIKDGRHHIDYVPTQVLTEFIRWELQVDDQPLDGIVYPSSVNGDKCYVIFADHDQCLEQPFGGEQLLRAIPETFQSTNAAIVREWRS